ncbi:hypothetical protein BHE74_00005600 [Ensete ventricosum]|nr:hypothetical protein GW17_00024693 [Ensete ventricosum]RWW85697.1 hypothetical protein BHE74_00005600 [Ensete ventricosum]
MNGATEESHTNSYSVWKPLAETSPTVSGIGTSALGLATTPSVPSSKSTKYFPALLLASLTTALGPMVDCRHVTTVSKTDISTIEIKRV